MALCSGLPGEPVPEKQNQPGFTGARDSEVAVASAGQMQICTSPRQITTPASHHSVSLQAGCSSYRSTKSVNVLNRTSPPKVGKRWIATTHGREWACPLHVLAVQCPLQTSPITQLPVSYIHTTHTDTRR